MLPLARKALTLVFLISSSNRGGGGGQHGASPSFLVEALPLDNKPPSNSDTGEVTPQRNTSIRSWCPSPRPRLSKCLSVQGQKCPESTILGVLGVNASMSTDKGPPALFSSGADCVMYFQNTDSVVSNETKIFSSAYLPINTTSIQLVFRVRVNDSTCILNVQQYNYTDQDCEKVEMNVSSFPFCTQISYNCAGEEERRLLAELESRGVLLRTSELQKPPLPLVAHSKSTELRRVERAEVIRRVKKPISWNWRDHILEISLVSIVAAVLILIGLKRCLAGTRRLMNLSSHSRVVRFDLDELDEKRRRFSSCVMSSPPRQIDYTKNPSKPILKNRPKLSHPPLNRVLGQTHSSAIKSFDSSSSIYYDAIEGPSSAAVVAPPEESSSHSQPLISEF